MAVWADQKGEVETLLFHQSAANVKRYSRATLSSFDAAAKSTWNHSCIEDTWVSLHSDFSSKYACHLLQQHSRQKYDEARLTKSLNKKVFTWTGSAVRDKSLRASGHVVRIELALESRGCSDRTNRAAQSTQHWYQQKKQRIYACSTLWWLYKTATSSCKLS